MTSYPLITFDAYTALFDTKNSLEPQVSRIMSAKDTSMDISAFVEIWRAKQLECAAIVNAIQKDWLSFQDCTKRALDYTLRRFQINVSQDKQIELMNAWHHLTPWPEAGEVLAGLKDRGYQIAVLSNGDQGMLRAAVANLPVPFDYIFGADMAKAYKPRPEIYFLPLNQLSLTKNDILHVAGSATDTLGAKSVGLGCFWSNRNRDLILDPIYSPDFEFESLSGLLEVL